MNIRRGEGNKLQIERAQPRLRAREVRERLGDRGLFVRVDFEVARFCIIDMREQHGDVLGVPEADVEDLWREALEERCVLLDQGKVILAKFDAARAG